MKSFPARVLAIVAALSLIVNLLLYLRYSDSRPLVTVGSQVITKKEYRDQLDYTAGETVMRRLVLTALVMQAASREGVVPTEKDVDTRWAMLERRSPQVLIPYSQDATKMTEFRQDLMTTIALENLRSGMSPSLPRRCSGIMQPTRLNWRCRSRFGLPR